MRHLCLISALFALGCSTHPVTNTLDFFKPGKMYANEVAPYGGVCIQQGPVIAPGVTVPPIVVPDVVPPPVPLPGAGEGPPPSFPVPKGP
jgi:hypothetical protein